VKEGNLITVSFEMTYEAFKQAREVNCFGGRVGFVSDGHYSFQSGSVVLEIASFWKH